MYFAHQGLVLQAVPGPDIRGWTPLLTGTSATKVACASLRAGRATVVTRARRAPPDNPLRGLRDTPPAINPPSGYPLGFLRQPPTHPVRSVQRGARASTLVRRSLNGRPCSGLSAAADAPGRCPPRNNRPLGRPKSAGADFCRAAPPLALRRPRWGGARLRGVAAASAAPPSACFDADGSPGVPASRIGAFPLPFLEVD